MVRGSFLVQIFAGCLAFFSISAFAQLRIDLSKLLIGIEYSFQNSKLYAEDVESPSDVSPYKRKLMKRFFQAYMDELAKEGFASIPNVEGVSGSPIGIFYIDPRSPFDPAHAYGQSNYDSVLHSDLRVIEVAEKPKKLAEILSASRPLFAAAANLGLKNEVRPGGIWGGGAHYNIGTRDIDDSPFLQYPNLLPNLLAYVDQHASLLYGFGEAYDVGREGTAVPYHSPSEAKRFREILKAFHQQYTKAANIAGSPRNIVLLTRFLEDIKELNHHDRFINLEHFTIPKTRKRLGRNAIEIRGVRMPATELHAEAIAKMWVTILEKLSEPGLLIEPQPPRHFDTMLTASAIEADWEIVRKEMGLNDLFLDQIVAEQIAPLRRKMYRSPDLPEAEIFNAFSSLADKGVAFEIRLPDTYDTNKLALNKRLLSFKKIHLQDKAYQIAYVHPIEYEFSPVTARRGKIRFTCIELLKKAG